MKQFFSVCCITAILLTLFNMTFLASVHAQESLSLTVENGAICLDVINREIIDAGTSFSVSVGKLYCFTRIVGAHNPTSVTHVWNYGETERARVTLEVNSANWRTYSSKIIQIHEIGEWHVDVLDTSGNILETFRFNIVRE